MKHSPISVLLALHICIVPPLSAQLTLTLGVDTTLTQIANTNGAADTAFDNWTSSIIAATPSISTWNTATDHELGTVGGFQMDTGISASSPFGAAPSPINVNITTPTTRTHTSGFTYTVHSVRQFDTTPPPSAPPPPSGWNVLPAGSTLLGSTTGILREQANAANRAATLADALFQYRVESPAAQDSANVSPDGRNTWGFDGLSLAQDNNRRGFVLSFSSPLSAFGFMPPTLKAPTPTGSGVWQPYLTPPAI